MRSPKRALSGLSPCPLWLGANSDPLKLHRALRIRTTIALQLSRVAMASSPSSSATAANAQPAPTASSSELIASTSSTPAPPQHIKPIVPEGMSKNAHKRLLKQQAFDAAKPARRAKERALRKEKTAEKRKLIELGLLEKPVTKQAAFAELGGRRPFGARVVIDCSFDELMTEKVRQKRRLRLRLRL